MMFLCSLAEVNFTRIVLIKIPRNFSHQIFTTTKTKHKPQRKKIMRTIFFLLFPAATTQSPNPQILSASPEVTTPSPSKHSLLKADVFPHYITQPDEVTRVVSEDYRSLGYEEGNGKTTSLFSLGLWRRIFSSDKKSGGGVCSPGDKSCRSRQESQDDADNWLTYESISNFLFESDDPRSISNNSEYLQLRNSENDWLEFSFSISLANLPIDNKSPHNPHDFTCSCRLLPTLYSTNRPQKCYVSKFKHNASVMTAPLHVHFSSDEKNISISGELICLGFGEKKHENGEDGWKNYLAFLAIWKS